ncbi:MAG: trehalose-6-phosphate synthase, partial [Burkholderiaceae bacterium]
MKPLLKLEIRFLIPLIAVLVFGAYIALPLMDRLTLRWFSRDLGARGELVTRAMSDVIVDALGRGDPGQLQTLFDRAIQDERLVGIALCAADGTALMKTGGYPETIDCPTAARLAAQPQPRLSVPSGALHVGVHPLVEDNRQIASLVLLQDLSFIDRRSRDTRRLL